VLSAETKLGPRFEVVRYGRLDFDPNRYPLVAYRSRTWRDELPIVLVTGGVHGYETSGVHGALRFLERHAADYQDRVNLLVAPCVSPWAYETIQRWNMHAVDPNRSFGNGAAPESVALMQLVAPFRERVLVHIDLHETTDSDEGEFRPALAARDGEPFEPGIVPDGFYVVDDAERPQTEFQSAVIAAVSRVTHIAEPDDGESPPLAIGQEVVEEHLANLGREQAHDQVGKGNPSDGPGHDPVGEFACPGGQVVPGERGERRIILRSRLALEPGNARSAAG